MIQVRKAATVDLPAMLVIFNEILLNTTAVWDDEPQTLEMRTKWFEEKKQKGFPVFVAEEDGVIVGFSTFGPFRPHSGYRHTVENSVYVAAGRRGKGIGKLLLEPLIDAAVKMDVHVIVAGIDAENIESLHLHKQFGFVEVAFMKEVGFKFDHWMDLIFMQLILEE